jgi:dihydrofolate reductase
MTVQPFDILFAAGWNHVTTHSGDQMRRIINSTYITLDGVIKDPQDWPSIDSSDDGGTKIQTDLLLNCDAVLLGRDTYESFASVWQGQSGDPYTDQMNSMTKYVVSSTLTHPDWENTTVITHDVAAEVRRIKDQPGNDVLTYGFGRLGRELMDNALLDEIRLWVHPFFIGGTDTDRILYGQCPAARLELTSTRVLKSGIIILSYKVQQDGR